MKQRTRMVMAWLIVLIGLGLAQTAAAHGFRGGRVVVRAPIFHPARAAVVVRAPLVRVHPAFHRLRTAVVVGVPLDVPLFYPPPYFPPVFVASSAPPVYIAPLFVSIAAKHRGSWGGSIGPAPGPDFPIAH